FNGLNLVHRRQQLADHLGIERVVAFGPVQPQGRYAVVAVFELDCREAGHGLLKRCGGSQPPRLSGGCSNHILNTPNRVGTIGAFSAADIASPNTSRVCTGSITPSSHNRALE